MRQATNYHQVRDKQSLLAERDRILTDLMSKHRLGRQSPKIQAAKEALDRFVETLNEHTT